MFIAIIFISVISVGCEPEQTPDEEAPDTTDTAWVEPTLMAESMATYDTNQVETMTVIEHEISTVTMLAVGDLMFHRAQLTRAYDYGSDTFDFSGSFEDVAPYIRAADFSIGNLETTLAGAHNQRRFRVEDRIAGYSGFPAFNTPEVAVDNIIDAGFDLVSTANNHSLDSYDSGLFATIDVLDEKGISHVGTYKTLEESQEIHIETIEGMTFAFVNYTYGMNGFWPEEGHEYIIDHLDIYDPVKVEEMNEKVRLADESGVDFVIVMMHWGNEYIPNENHWQQDVTDGLFDSGADVIFGGHPHVLQPIEIRQLENVDGSIRTGVVIYSLGNFLSAQRYGDGAHKDLGVMMQVHFKQVDQLAYVEGISVIPTYTYRHDDAIGIYPVDEVLMAYESGQRQLTDYDYNRLSFASQYTVDHLYSYIDGYVMTNKNGAHYIQIH